MRDVMRAIKLHAQSCDMSKIHVSGKILIETLLLGGLLFWTTLYIRGSLFALYFDIR